MMPLFRLSTCNYDSEIILVKNAMEELEKKCSTVNDFTLAKPFNKAGWTFFDLQITDEMLTIIEKSGMMKGAIGNKIGEQLKIFYVTF